MRIAAAVLSLIIGFSSSAIAAEILAGGNLFGTSRTHIVCQFFNANYSVDRTVRIINPQILDQFGTPFPLAINTCDDTPRLAAGRSCTIRVNNTEERSWSCRANIAPTKENVRGVLDLRRADQSVVTNIELR